MSASDSQKCICPDNASVAFYRDCPVHGPKAHPEFWENHSSPGFVQPSDSHRAEVRDHEHVYRCQDCGEQFEDSTYRTVIIDAEKERWIGEVKAALPAKKPSEAYYQEQANAVIIAERYGFNAALDAVSKVLDEL